MDLLQRVLPSTNLISSEKSAKDTKHKKHSRQISWQVINNVDEPIETVIPEVASFSPEQTKDERRTSSDRRLSAKKRGRWLESRNKKDRRQPIEISMKV